MKQQFLKPKAGLKVRDPKGGHLPEEGAFVPVSPYWTRRLNDRDVEKSDPPKTEEVQGDDVATPKSKPKKKES